jgi:hypothetical protein
MRSVRGRQIAIAAVLLSFLFGACGEASGEPGDPRVLSTAEARKLLLQLPYRFHFRPVQLPDGASGALAGTAIGEHRTIVRFGIALGREAEPVPVPKAGTRGYYDYTHGGGFVYTDDMLVPDKNGRMHANKQYRTNAQWYEAANMIVDMQQKLCYASTGEPCPP